MLHKSPKLNQIVNSDMLTKFGPILMVHFKDFEHKLISDTHHNSIIIIKCEKYYIIKYYVWFERCDRHFIIFKGYVLDATINLMTLP